MTIEEAIQVAERLEREDCIGTTSQALRALLRAYKQLQRAYKVGYDATYEEDDVGA